LHNRKNDCKETDCQQRIFTFYFLLLPFTFYFLLLLDYMCGIVGFIHKENRPIDESLLRQMNEAIRHRGPDEDGFYINENVGLAMRRLSIIDLTSGQQPIHNQDKTAWIVFNGEIYNYQELRERLERLGHTFYTNSDTEVIVHAYDQYGADCPKHLRGMFAFAIWDTRDKSLFLARDRVGKKPLLYAQHNGDLIFASEFQALILHPDVSREINHEAIHQYLSYLCVPAPLTAYKQIKKLEPGHWLRWREGEIKTERYWQPDFNNKIKISEEEAGEKALEILHESVRLRLISEVPLGAFLSGGIDSSAVVALMAEQSDKPVKTFSIGFEEQDFTELHHAKRVAEHIGADHHEFIVHPNALEILPMLVEHYGEPFADSSAIPTYYVARETRKHVTVALNGDGGDESFAGYERYAAMKLAECYNKIPGLLRKAFIESPVSAFPVSIKKKSRVRDAKRFLKAASLPKVERYFDWVNVLDKQTKDELYTKDFQNEVGHINPADNLARWFTQANGAGIVDSVLLTDTMTYLPDDLLVKVDIATMAVSLEARSPFLDHNVIEFAASLPEDLKLRGLTTKYLLKKILGRLLPQENLTRRKMGFGVPISHWFRGEMKNFLNEILLSERASKRGILKQEKVEQLISQHTNGAHDYGQALWTLLMLELWFQKFID
jgi:asparagine synthase (glutamine-hydrolysing)